MQRKIQRMKQQCTLIPSPIGTLYAVFIDGVLSRLSRATEQDMSISYPSVAVQTADSPVRADAELHELSQQISAIFTHNHRYTAPFSLVGLSPFQQKVLACTAEIPRGAVRSYGFIAHAIGHPGASRAVGTALAKNPLPWVIPCHRVIHADGKLGAYSGGGTAIKARLLELEGVKLGRAADKIVVAPPFEPAFKAV
jgi:methylated-DNA-[protein]-cysteine S-methyltransferase